MPDTATLRTAAVLGDVHAEIPQLSRIIRLFISSTFKDMTVERDKIMHVLYPKLEKYCSSKHYILQIVDMRWGIFESVANEQATTDICLKEVCLARELSSGPFFIAILSHRYGSKFPPRYILEDEFQRLLGQCDDTDQSLLLEWYDIDKNNLPPLYYLKSLDDETIKKKWRKTDNKRLCDLLSCCARTAELNEQTLMKYTRSVTELEIEEGIFHTTDCNLRCFAFFRTINICDQMESNDVSPELLPIISKYVDTYHDKQEMGSTSQVMMKQLKERIKQKLRRENFKDLVVDVNSSSELTEHDVFNEKFENYLVEFCETFERTVVNLIETNMNKNEVLFEVLEKHADLFHHIRFCKAKARTFLGRAMFLNKLKSLLVDENQQYVVIHGISGSGKTTLMAKLAMMLKSWFPNIKFTLVLRFIGTSEDSYNIQHLLSSIIKQLAIRFNLVVNYEEMSPIDKLYNYFKKFLINLNNNEEHIFILLDSLDQLSTEHAARKLDWFPIDLPQNIRFIVSTLTKSDYEVFPALRSLIKTEHNYIEIGHLKEDEIPAIIRYRLEHAHRTVTNDQMNYLLDRFKVCSIPLYIKLVLDQAIEWKHSLQTSELFVSDDVKKAIHDLLAKLETSYGQVFVKTVLQYITLSRHGLYENYLQKVLAHDRTVVDYIRREFRHDKVTGDRIPQIFLIRLIHALREYFSGPMYRWYHRAFWEVAQDRYCQNVESNQNCHQVIVETFLVEKYNRHNPFWMNELPYHAICANDVDSLKNEFLLNLEFMQLKIESSDVDQLIADYALAVQTYPQDETLKLVHQMLLIAAYKIRFNPSQLPGQLFGRLSSYKTGQDLDQLLEQCLSPPQQAIVPNQNFMAGPNPLLSKSIIAHKAEIKSTLITKDNQYIISCSSDNFIKVFDANTFTEQKTIHKKYDSTSSLTVSNDHRMLYAWCRITNEKERDQPLIEAFDLNTGDHLFVVHPNILQDDRAKHREVLFSEIGDELWLVTKHFWYHLDWQTGQLQNRLTIPHEFAKNEDKIICIDQAQDRIVMALDIHPLVLSLNKNGDHTLRDLKDETVMGRRFLILPNRTLVISTRRQFKSLLDGNDMEWNILLCDLVTLETKKKIPVSKALRIWQSSLDNTKLFCNAFNYIYVLDIEKRQTDFILEHSSQMNSCSLLNETTIISATWDNKLHVWDLKEAARSMSQQSLQSPTRVNLFDTFNSRMIRFIHDDFNTLSRYVFVYNIFDENAKELFVLFDLARQCLVRKCEIHGYSRNDLQPVNFINDQTVLLLCLSQQLYAFLDMNQFTISKQLTCAETRVFTRINSKQAVMSIRDVDDSLLVLLDCNDLSYEKIIPNWINIEWYSVNTQTIIYKIKSNETIYIYNFLEKFSSCIQLDLSKTKSVSQVISSLKGKYVATIYMDSINIHRLKEFERSCSFEKTNLSNLGQVVFIGDEYLVYQCKEGPDRLTYCLDLSNNMEHLWFKDDDSLGSFDCLKHERSQYIWYQRYQVSRLNRVKTDISVYDIQDVSKPIATLDVDCRLKINQVTLLDNGNAFLVKVLDKLEFVAFFLKSKTNHIQESTIAFDNLKLNDVTTTFILRNEQH